MAESKAFKVVIPARYQSSRFPGKPLAKIAGKEMVLHVYELAMQSAATEVVIATDDQRIFDLAAGCGAKVTMTSKDHATGTDRLVEVVATQGWPADTIIVNVQGDEPLIPIACIDQVAQNLHQNASAVMATLATQINSESEFADPNVVKVVFDAYGMAMLFSRATIPFDRDRGFDQSVTCFRHLGIYAYRAGYLQGYSSLPECVIETAEKLEQLRVLYNGDRIHVDVALEVPGPGVDTAEQLIEVEAMLLARAAANN